MAIKLKFNKDLYSLEPVLNAGCLFLDKCYVFIDFKADQLEVLLKPKKKLNLVKLKDQFLNQLKESSLYFKIDKNNKKFKKYLVGQALFPNAQIYDPAFLGKQIDESTEIKDYKDDPLEISVPWEEKYDK